MIEKRRKDGRNAFLIFQSSYFPKEGWRDVKVSLPIFQSSKEIWCSEINFSTAMWVRKRLRLPPASSLSTHWYTGLDCDIFCHRAGLPQGVADRANCTAPKRVSLHRTPQVSRQTLAYRLRNRDFRSAPRKTRYSMQQWRIPSHLLSGVYESSIVSRCENGCEPPKGFAVANFAAGLA